MWWIIIIVVLLLQIFLWLVLHAATRSINDEMQAKLDEEQTRAVNEYLKNKEKKAQNKR